MESQTPLTISAEYGLIDQNKFFGKRIAAKDLSNYYLIQKGEFAYNKSTSNDAPWGAIKRLDCYNNGALSTLYIVFKIKDNKSCYSDFLVTYYGTSLWHKGVKEIATEGARNHGLLNVSPSDFFRTKLVIPQDFEEQRKIGAFFTQLDNTITLQQRKLNSLQKLKKGLLQKMFPKKGENIPEIRFPEFSDAWKQRKLGDILKLLKDGTHGSHKDVTNGHYLLSAKNIKDGRIFWDKTDRIISDEDYKKIHSTFKINKGDVLLTIVGSIGETAIFNVSEEITFQRSVAILRPIDEVSSDFLYSEITSPKFQKFLNLNKSTSAQPGIYLGDLANISFSFPENKEEQKMIGRLFTGLNSTITLQQRKLESLQKLKKGLLQQMFI